MSYERQNFTDGQKLKAEHLNHIEDGLEANSILIVTIDEETGMASHNSVQIYEHVQAGGTAMLAIGENSLLGLSFCEEFCCSFTHYYAEEGNFEEYRILEDGSVEYYSFDAASYDAIYNTFIPNPYEAKVGQTIVVKTVDEYGMPTQWKAVDIVKRYPTDPQLSITVAEEAQTIFHTDIDGKPIADYGFTSCFINVENAAQTAEVAGNLRIFLNSENYWTETQPILSVPTPFIKATTKKYWGGSFDMVSGLAQFMSQATATAGGAYASNLYSVPIASFGKEVISSIGFSAYCGIPVGTKIKVWFK